MSIDTYPPQNVTAQTPTLGYAERTVYLPVGTTTTDIPGVSVTITVPAGRRVRLTAFSMTRKFTTTDFVWLRIMEGNSFVGSALEHQTASDYGTMTVMAVISPTAGMHTYRMVAYTGSGTVDLLGSVEYPIFILAEDITGSQLPVLPQSVPVGALASAQVAVTQTGITGGDLTGLSVNVVVPAGRQLKITGHVGQFSRTAGTVTYVGLAIAEGNDWIAQTTVSLNNTYGGSDVTAIVSPTAGSHTYHLTTYTDGTVQMEATVGNIAYILVEDITPTPAPGQGAPGSTLAYAEKLTSQTGITTVTDISGLSVTVTVPAGRRLRVSTYAQVAASVDGAMVYVSIREGSTYLQYGQVQWWTGNIAEGLEVSPSVVLTPSAGVHTYKFSMEYSGTGTVSLGAGATYPAYILVEDITGAVWPVGSTVTAGMVAPDPWTSYTPATTGITIGNGTLTGRYQRVGRTIHYAIRFILGSSSAVTGGITFSLPATPASPFDNGDFPIGDGAYLDAGATVYLAQAHYAGGGVFNCRAWLSTGTYVSFTGLSSGIPHAWGSGDAIFFKGTYEAVS